QFHVGHVRRPIDRCDLFVFSRWIQVDPSSVSFRSDTRESSSHLAGHALRSDVIQSGTAATPDAARPATTHRSFTFGLPFLQNKRWLLIVSFNRSKACFLAFLLCAVPSVDERHFARACGVWTDDGTR